MDPESQQRAELLLREEQLQDQLKAIRYKIQELAKKWRLLSEILSEVVNYPTISFANCKWSGPPEAGLTQRNSFDYNDYRGGIDEILGLIIEWQTKWGELKGVYDALRRERDKRRLP